MESLHIGPASPEDREWSACLMASSEPWITLQRDLPACRAVLARPGTELFIARARAFDPPLGFILLAEYGFAGSPYIASIGVSPPAQGRGIGGQMLSFAESLFHKRHHMFLLVSSFNARAQKFYKCHGFHPVGELKDYIVAGHSELIFHKRLAS